MKTNGIPAIVMLLAGFVDCLIAIRTHMTLGNFTRQLFLVLLIFYVIGCTVKLILDRNMKAMEEVKTVKEELGKKKKKKKRAMSRRKKRQRMIQRRKNRQKKTNSLERTE